MAENRFNHRGHEVVIDETPDVAHVSVDGEAVHASRIGPGLYAHAGLPYTNFTSLDSLAKAVIDLSPAFYGRRDLKPGERQGAKK